MNYQQSKENEADACFCFASFQDTLYSNSCLLMTWNGRHPYRTPLSGEIRLTLALCGTVNQSDLLSDDTIIRFGEPWKEASLLFKE